MTRYLLWYVHASEQQEAPKRVLAELNTGQPVEPDGSSFSNTRSLELDSSIFVIQQVLRRHRAAVPGPAAHRDGARRDLLRRGGARRLGLPDAVRAVVDGLPRAILLHQYAAVHAREECRDDQEPGVPVLQHSAPFLALEQQRRTNNEYTGM